LDAKILLDERARAAPGSRSATSPRLDLKNLETGGYPTEPRRSPLGVREMWI
jgi:hypothetical protein